MHCYQSSIFSVFLQQTLPVSPTANRWCCHVGVGLGSGDNIQIPDNFGLSQSLELEYSFCTLVIKKTVPVLVKALTKDKVSHDSLTVTVIPIVVMTLLCHRVNRMVQLAVLDIQIYVSFLSLLPELISELLLVLQGICRFSSAFRPKYDCWT